MAETKTTTAFTCAKKAKKGGAGFSKEHCATADAVGTEAEFEHVEIAPGAWTSIEGTNAKTSSETAFSTESVLKATIAGLKATIEANTMSTSGEEENFTELGIMDIKGRNIVITLTGAFLSGPLATFQGCKLATSEIKTNKLVFTSLVNTHEFEYKPESGEVLTKFTLIGCKTAELNKTFEVTGSFKAIVDGATRETTEASTKGLKVAGQQASFVSKSTVRMFAGGNPISPTTIIDF